MKAFKIVGIIFAVIAILIIGAGIAVYTLFPPSKIKAMVLPQAEKALGRQVNIDKVGLSIYPFFGVRIQGLQVANTSRAGFSSDPFVKLSDFNVKIKVLPLLHKKLDIREIVLKQPWILVETDSTGSFNFSDLAMMAKDTTVKAAQGEKKAGPALPIPLTLDKFAIEKGSILYWDRKGGTKISLGEINQQVNMAIDQELKDIRTNGQLVISNISVLTKDVPKPMSGLTLTFSHDLGIDVVNGMLSIKQVKASLQKIAITLVGSVKNFNAKPDLDLSITSDRIAIADILAEIPLEVVKEIRKTQATGNAEFTVKVAGVVDSTGPSIDGTLKIMDGMVRYTDLPEAIKGLNVDLAFTGNSLNIANLELSLGPNPIKARALIENFKKPRIDAMVDAKVNLDDLKNIVAMPQGTSVGGTVIAKIEAKGEVDPADPARLALNGNVALNQVTATTPAVTKPVVANGVIDFTAKRIAPKLQVVIGSSSMNFSGELTEYLSLATPAKKGAKSRPRLNFTIASPLLNTNEFLPASSSATAETKPQTTAASAPAKTATTPQLLLPAPLPGFDMVGSITTGKLIYQQAELNNLRLKFNAINDIINLDVKTGLFEGSMSQVLDVDARNNRDLSTKSVLTISNVQLSKLITAFKGYIPDANALIAGLKNIDQSLSGKVNVQSDLVSRGGTMDDLLNKMNGTIKTQFLDGSWNGPIIRKIAASTEKFFKLDGLKFRDYTLNATIKNGVVTLDKCAIAAPLVGDWDFKGSAGFDGSMNLNASAHLTSALSKPIVALQNGAKNAAAGLLQKGLGGSAAGAAVAGIAGNAINQGGIPIDKEGRVTMLFGIGGKGASPVINSMKFGGENAAAQPQATTPQQNLKEQAQQKAQEVQQQAQQAVQQKVDQTVQQGTQKIEEAAKQQSPQTQQTIKKAEDAVKSKLKKLF
jgi:hypothetical protein